VTARSAQAPSSEPGRSRPELVALDIDGTLVDYQDGLSPAVRRAVQATVEAGVEVVLATGRSVHGVERVLELLGLEAGTCIASNGAVTFTYFPVEISRAITFDPEPAVRKVLEQVPDALVAVEVIGRGYRANDTFPEGEITGEMWIESVEELVREPVSRVIIRDPQSSAEDFLSLAGELGLHGINYFVGYTAWLDLAPEGVTKASALADVCADLGIPRERVLAIGDGRNDVEMLEWAGRGVAMGQSPDELVVVADGMTGTLEGDGAAFELAESIGFDLGELTD
jgi:hydroxymethylpyrimidine pyrophosphatase-like HAD family hydrolase